MEIKQEKMVVWFSPGQLLKTATEVAISTVFGKNADNRLLEAALNPVPKDGYLSSNTPPVSDFWIDYISDVGDGWDSTYTMAYHLSQPELHLGQETTKRGNILIFGGDEIYPTASAETYRNKLITPYETAFPDPVTDDSPTVFAIPGNHDWYDSLVSFRHIFSRKENFAGWKTIQDRSYFAIALPRGWWLFGTDFQLGSSLDSPQIEYFKSIMKLVKSDDRIILCNAEPYWIYSKVNEKDKGNTQKDMDYFQGKVLEDKVALYLAGDLHHYRRHENTKKHKHKITAGGGGAFLHPTHGKSVEKIGIKSIYQLKKSFPEIKDSRRMCWGNLFFVWHNPGFGLVTGLLYVFTAKSFGSNLIEVHNFYQAVELVLESLATSNSAYIWLMINLAGLFYFTDKYTRSYQRVLSTAIHAAFHFASMFVISWASLFWLNNEDWLTPHPVWKSVLLGVLIYLGGHLIGSTLLGIYLFITMNMFGWNPNEAFASMSIKDYKNFLRLKIDHNGDLTVFPVGVRRVARKWKKGEGKSSKLIPDDQNATSPELIEDPIFISKKEVVVEAEKKSVTRLESDPGKAPNISQETTNVKIIETKIPK